MDRPQHHPIDGRDRPTPRQREPNGKHAAATGLDARWLAGFAVARAMAMDPVTDDAIADLVAVVLSISSDNGNDPLEELRYAADLVEGVEEVDESTRRRALHLMRRTRHHL